MDSLDTFRDSWAPTVGPLGVPIQTLGKDNFFVFWAISKISKLTTISFECSKKFQTLMTLLGTYGYLQGPLSSQSIPPRKAFINILEGRVTSCFFGKFKKFQIHLVNYLNMLALLDRKPSLAGIFSALWHIVAEIPTNIDKFQIYMYKHSKS